jgi:hypothetical protein
VRPSALHSLPITGAAFHDHLPHHYLFGLLALEALCGGDGGGAAGAPDGGGGGGGGAGAEPEEGMTPEALVEALTLQVNSESPSFASASEEQVDVEGEV